MATSAGTVEAILEQAGGLVSARKMFGEYALYRDGKLVALVCDDELFVKITEAGRALIGQAVEAPPYPGAKPCFRIDADLWEDGERLSRLLQETAASLPEPRPRKPRAASRASRGTP